MSRGDLTRCMITCQVSYLTRFHSLIISTIRSFKSMRITSSYPASQRLLCLFHFPPSSFILSLILISLGSTRIATIREISFLFHVSGSQSTSLIINSTVLYRFFWYHHAGNLNIQAFHHTWRIAFWSLFVQILDSFWFSSEIHRELFFGYVWIWSILQDKKKFHPWDFKPSLGNLEFIALVAFRAERPSALQTLENSFFSSKESAPAIIRMELSISSPR